ncbi:MAG: hypothetical protein ACYC9Q_09755 [Bacillota bacterium]
MLSPFYLISTETTLIDPPLECKAVKRLHNRIRDDLVLVSVAPPLPSYAYGTKTDLTHLILAPKFERGALLQAKPRELPIYVYISPVPSIVGDDGFVSVDTLQILDWGAVYLDFEVAKRNILAR